jgi:hypothetical protein
MPLSFEQQPKESAKAFAAFSLYLSLGPQRSLAEAAQKLSKSTPVLKRWSRRWAWPARVAAHAAHLATVERTATEALTRSKAAGWVQRQEAHREEEWTLRGELIEAGRKVLEKFRDGSRGATLGDVARALDLASKLGRLASGMPTETVEATAEVDVNFRLEIEAAVKKVYGQAESAPTIVDVEAVASPRECERELPVRGVLP